MSGVNRVVNSDRIKNAACLNDGCYHWQQSQKGRARFRPDCSRCGFFREEDARRKALPLVQDEDGLWCKHIPPADRPYFDGCPSWMAELNCPGIDCESCWTRGREIYGLHP